MTKAQIHFSNDLDTLIGVLKTELFPEGAGPFDKRLIAVPHMALKERILMAFAGDPQIRVAAGMHIVTLDQAYTTLTGKSLPSNLELSLFLQHEILDMIDRVEPLRAYFSASSREERIGPFCDALATYFLRYKTYGKPELPRWQEELFSRLPWIFPSDFRGKVTPHLLHLFGFSQMPSSYFSLFERAAGTFYFFSPCAIFWGDFFSDKERVVIQKGMGPEQLGLFDHMADDQNPLLANWGKVGRRLQLMVEETEVPSWEHYTTFDTSSAIGRLQETILEGVTDKPQADESIQIHSATSRLREVEILKDQLLSLFAEGEISPSDIQIAAPDINVYAPLIEAVFDNIDIAIEGIEFQLVDPLRAAFDKLVALPESRFEVDAVLQLLSEMKGDFDLGQIRRWVDAADIRWGFSEASRFAHYSRDLEKGDIHALSKEGTWMEGLRKLILGLGTTEGGALPLVGITEMEAFDTLYRLLCDLADDLSPLFDGTRWTIPTWLRYLACLMASYFPIEPSHDFYRGLLQLASTTDHLDREEIPFEGIRRVIDKRQGKSLSAPHLQAVRCCSLSEGCLVPSKVIYLLGIEEGAFPRREAGASLYHGELEPRPKQTDTDRYLFLQGLFFARDHFFVSYVRDPEGKQGLSLVIEQLMSQMVGCQIIDHPGSAIDPRYYGGDLKSYDDHAYTLLEAEVDPKLAAPLVPSFYTPTILEKVELEEISLKNLAKFARHPLRYHLHEVLGIYPSFRFEDNRDYLLDPLSRTQLVMERLQGKPVETRLPLNLFQPLAHSQIEEEVEQWREVTGGEPFSPYSISMEVGPYSLKGIVETATSRGWFFRAKDTLEDKVRFFPQLLIASNLGIPVTFIRDGSQPEVEGNLEAYLNYFAHAQEHPSPLVPALAKGFFSGDPQQVKRALKQLDDEVWSYLCLRDPLPDAETILVNWQPYIQAAFGGVHAQV